MDKLLNKNINIEEIAYKINSKQEKHTCLNKNNNNYLIVSKAKIKTYEEEKNLAITLIKTNLEEIPTFHINNLNNNNIFWKNKKIIDLVYKLQEEKYPSNNIYFKTINQEYIYLGDKDNISNKYIIVPKQIFSYNFIKKNMII